MDGFSTSIVIGYIFLVTLISAILAGNLASKNYEDDADASANAECGCIEEMPAGINAGVSSSLSCLVLAAFVTALAQNMYVGVALALVALSCGVMGAGLVTTGQIDPPLGTFYGLEVCAEDTECTTKEVHGWNWGMVTSSSLTVIAFLIVVFFFVKNPDSRPERFRVPPSYN